MTIEEFRAAGMALFGHGWQTRLAERLRISPRTVRRWASGEVELPEWAEVVLQKHATEPVIPELPEWIIGEEWTGGREFIIHTHAPRFVARITDDGELMSDLVWVNDVGEQVGEVAWIDLPPPDAQQREWLQKAAEAVDTVVPHVHESS